MDASLVELKSALASLFENPRYSDLTIACGGKRYPVHRALLATRSTFFEGACRNTFLEAQTGIIDLSEDDAEAVGHMIHYFYHLDYLNKPASACAFQSERRPSISSPPSTRSVPKKLNLVIMEDPLLATASWSNTAMPLTPPADEPNSPTMDALTKLPATPIADQVEADDYFQSEQPNLDANFETPHLVTHAKVYAIAEKYGITGLKSLARKKFAQELDLSLDSADFSEACQEAYESTFHTDRGLRDVIVQAFRANPGLSLRPDVEMMIRETPSLAFELFRMASGLPVAS